MADSPVSHRPDEIQVAAIRSALSEQRFQTYLVASGHDVEHAIALYLYNARLAKSFLFPLQMVEVTLRNAIDDMLTRAVGPGWTSDTGFSRHILSEDGRSALDRGASHAGRKAHHDQIVASLSFDFWSNMLRDDYAHIWRTKLNVVFPNIPQGTTRRDVQRIAIDVNRYATVSLITNRYWR